MNENKNGRYQVYDYIEDRVEFSYNSLALAISKAYSLKLLVWDEENQTFLYDGETDILIVTAKPFNSKRDIVVEAIEITDEDE